MYYINLCLYYLIKQMFVLLYLSSDRDSGRAPLSQIERRWYISYNRVPHSQASKKSSLHASIIPKLCIGIEHGVSIAMLLVLFRNPILVGLYDCLKLA